MARAGNIIVGTGQAGFQTAASLRMEGYQDPITLIGEEPHIPYQRPSLSKGFVLGKQDAESIELRPVSFYADHQINLLNGETVVAISRSEKTIEIASGGQLSYDSLVLATGASNRKLAVKGAELEGVVYLRSLAESILIKASLEQSKEIVVVGGGFIGLEIAAVACTLGKKVTVIEALPRLMPRVVAPLISEFFHDLHTSHGVKILCGAAVSEIIGANGRVERVELADGSSYPADLVVVGIGVVPNVDLARNAGLAVSNGICVNEFLQTTDENIYAIGDCAEFPCYFTGSFVRLESVQNAADQAQSVAATIAGHRNPYRALPWFWTDQYEIKLQMAGISTGYDRIATRGNRESQKLSVFYFKGNKLLAIDSINRPADHMFGRKLISSAIPVTLEQAADETVDLRTLAHANPPQDVRSATH